MRTVQTTLLIFTFLIHAAKADCVIRSTIDVSGLGISEQLTLKFKGGKTRADVAGWSALFDSKSDKVTVLNHLNKTYSKRDGDSVINGSLGLLLLGGAGKNRVFETTDLKPTGRTETINGYKTEEFVGSMHGIRLKFFVDRSFPINKYEEPGFRQGASSPFFDAFSPFGSLADKCPGMPIRIVLDMTIWVTSFTMESIEQTPLEDGDFQIPADYSQGN